MHVLYFGHVGTCNMLFTRCARQAKLISDGMSDERTLEIQRAALELQQFEGYVRKRTTSSHNCPFRRPAHLPRGRRWTPRTPRSARARIRAPSLSPSGRKPPERGTATKETRPCRTSAPRKELVLRQADTLSLPAAGPGLHGVSQDLHEAWAIVTDLEVGGSNQPQRDLANHADALHDRGPPGASGIPCGERQRSPSPRATGTSRGRQVPLPQVEPQHEIPREDGPRSALRPGEGIPRPDQAEPPLPEGHPAVPCATPADRNHDGCQEDLSNLTDRQVTSLVLGNSSHFYYGLIHAYLWTCATGCHASLPA